MHSAQELEKYCILSDKIQNVCKCGFGVTTNIYGKYSSSLLEHFIKYTNLLPSITSEEWVWLSNIIAPFVELEILPTGAMG